MAGCPCLLFGYGIGMKIFEEFIVAQQIIPFLGLRSQPSSDGTDVYFYSNFVFLQKIPLLPNKSTNP